MANEETRTTFDVSKEPQKLRDRYGRGSRFGQGCLMARRLVEAGVPFVEVTLPGWDTHEANFERTRDLSQELDQGMSALLEDLRTRGLLSETLVLCMGEFGRTPILNERGGRDHFSRVQSAVLAGGGVPGGQVLGASTADGTQIQSRPIAIPDLLRTVAVRLGINPDEEHISVKGRPITTLSGGQSIHELIP